MTTMAAAMAQNHRKVFPMMSKVYTLAHGANVAFAENKEGAKVTQHACPDGYNPVIYELEFL